MEGFIGGVIGLIIGVGLHLLELNAYQRNLVMTANSHQNEKILGKWYSIKPMDRN
jgi:hypothetical protein